MVEELNLFLGRHRISLVLILIGGVLMVGGIFSSGLASFIQPAAKPSAYPQESLVSPENFNQIKIDVSGAVNNPAVYTLPANSRIEDAIRAAGGINGQANQEYLSKQLNLSQRLSDGQKVYVPSIGENGTVAGVGTTSNNQGKVGVNSASLELLDTLPGVGPVTAGKIISGRPYSSLDQLVARKVVSQSVFAKIKDLIDLD